MQLAALHHVTCVCSDARRTAEFYREELGFALVKKTVNFDDPHSYHLYFGDDTGSPGSLITFFEWPRAEAGRLGRGTLESIGLVVPSLDGERELEDPDGLRLRLRPGRFAAALRRRRVRQPGSLRRPRLAGRAAPFRRADRGSGSHRPWDDAHVAWRASDDEEQAAWLEHLQGLGLRPTPVQDRKISGRSTSGCRTGF